MGDNTTKIVLHVNNDTGKVEKAEHEDGTEATGNFDDVTFKQDTSAQMNWRAVPEPAPTEDDEGDSKSSSQSSSEAPSV